MQAFNGDFEEGLYFDYRPSAYFFVYFYGEAGPLSQRGENMKKMLLLAIVISGVLVGCRNDCNKLFEQVCADLGKDCEVFSANESIYTSILPKERYIRKAELSQCEMYLSKENYSAYTLPYVRYQIARLANPQTPTPVLPELAVDDSFLGLPSEVLYLLPVVCIIGIFLYIRRYSKLRNNTGVGKRQP
jgi:hypothetical protein